MRLVGAAEFGIAVFLWFGFERRGGKRSESGQVSGMETMILSSRGNLPATDFMRGTGQN